MSKNSPPNRPKRWTLRVFPDNTGDMIRKLMCLLSLLCLTACFQATVEVIPRDQAIKADLVKDLKFGGYTIDEDGTFDMSGPDDVYTVVGGQRPNDYIIQSDKFMTGPQTIRFIELEKNLYLMQVKPEDSNRYQLVLLRQKGQEFNVVMPDPYNKEGIDIAASQKEFARKLGLQLDGQGLGPFILTGDPAKIERFMHSLTTLPTKVSYKFKPL